MRRQCTVEIEWSTGVRTRVRMTERGLKLLQRYGVLYLLMRYELLDNEYARPVRYRIVR